ncbi:hypothetical protein ACJMK2_028442 [Sinanodonta woodiana]|uniref:RING-type domain-containing protein n=1 Tax=Sinanodonta woodiana TaxID=1069815 RepID=A0ABD3XAP2_SINWO
MSYYTDVEVFCNHEEGISNCTIDFCQKRQGVGLPSVLILPMDTALLGIYVLKDFQRPGSFPEEQIGYQYTMMNWDGRRNFKFQPGSPFKNSTYSCDKHFVYKQNTYPKLQQIHQTERVNLEAIHQYHGQLFELTLKEGGLFFGCVMICGFLLYYIIKIHVHEGTSFCSIHIKLLSPNDTVKEITMTCQPSEASGDENKESCINSMQCPKRQASRLCRLLHFLCNKKKVSEISANMQEERALHGTQDVTAQTSVSTESEVTSLSIKQKTLEVQDINNTWMDDLQVKMGFCEVADQSYLCSEVTNLGGKDGNVKTISKATNSTTEELLYLTRNAAVQINTKVNEQEDCCKVRLVDEFLKTTLKTSFQEVESCRGDSHAIIQGEELESSYSFITSHNLVKDDCSGDDQFLLQATCKSIGDEHEDKRNDISDYQDVHGGKIQPDGFSEILESVSQHKRQSYRVKDNDARERTVTLTASQKCLMKNLDSDISRDLTLSEERDKIALCFQGDMIYPESQPSASGEQHDFTPVTGTEESLLLVTEEPYDSSSLKYKEINDDKTDHSSIITGVGSDFISLESEKKTNKSLHSKLHLRTTGIASHNSKIKYAEDLINLNGGVLSPCKKRERSLSVRAFTTEDARCDQEKDAEETEQQILSDKDFSVHKKRREVEIDDRTVGDLQEKKRKYSLRQIIWLPMNSLPLPRLSREAIIGLVEEQTRDGHGGSTLPPSEHEDLSEMLRVLASDNVPGPQITMKYEMLRLCTMKTFPGRDRPFAIRIVGAGFYYAGHKDQVICYCCGNRKDSWVIGDIPLLIHQNKAPDCSFFTNNDRVNVPIRKANSTESPSLAEVRLLAVQRFYGSNLSDTAQNESSLMLPSSEQNWQHSISDNLPTVSAHVDSVLEPPPKYPQYAVKNMRINSFQGWPTELRQRPEEMAECGFYYAGFNDCVRCFHCGVGLRHWMNEDDPWIEHARWSTSCVYVLKMKGEEFVSLIKMAVEIVEREEAKSKNGGGNQALQKSNETATVLVMQVPKESGASNSSAAKDLPGSVGDTDGSVGDTYGNIVRGAESSLPPGNSEIQKYLLTDAAQSVLDMGYQPKLVLHAIERVLMKKGSDALTGEIILEAVFEIDEENIIQSQTQLVPLQSAEEDKGNENAQKSLNASNKQDGQPGHQASGNIQSDESQIDTEKIMKEHQELRDAILCKVCSENNISVVFLPCGHLVTCSDCAPAMRKCPICRTLIKGTVKTFCG